MSFSIQECSKRLTCSYMRSLFAIFLFALGTVSLSAQDTVERQYPRARPPRFNRDDVSHIFFDNLFDRLIGERPRRKSSHALGKTASSAAEGKGETIATALADGAPWSRVISATTLEDEVKSLKLAVDKTVTTPSSFAGRGHKAARLDFSLLAMLFAVIDQFDGDVRWRENASLARDLFARTASNLKAGGSIQVYNEAKKRKQDLDDLVRGSRLQGTGGEELDWSSVVERSPLMELLESRFEANLKSWTSNDEQLRAHADQVVREAELTALIGTVLLADGMDDADDEDYRPFAKSLADAARELARAAKAKDAEAARQAMAQISRSCVDCHDSYR